MYNYENFGNLIRQLRTESGISQQQFADQLLVSRGAVSMWEAGKRLPDITMISRIATRLGVETYMLLDAMADPDMPPCVIIVEDENVILTGFVHILEESLPHAEIYGFLCAEDALGFAESNRIDIAFLDIELRGGSGIELSRQVMKRQSRLNVIFLTGHTEYTADALAVHCSGYLMKPLTPEKIDVELAHLRFPVRSIKSQGDKVWRQNRRQ